MAVVGVEGDNNRAKDNLEGEANPCPLPSPAVRAREFDQAATKPVLLRFAIFSDTVDSNKTRLIIEFMKNNRITTNLCY